MAFGVPGIVRGLHANPDAGTVAEQFAEPNRHGRRHRFELAQNIVEMLAGDAEKLWDLGFGPAGRWNHILPQQSAGMSWASLAKAHVQEPRIKVSLGFDALDLTEARALLDALAS